MKRIVVLVGLTMLLAVSVCGVTPTIYINPGHGGYNAQNDRNIATIPYALDDTLGFWESTANLTKGLYLKQLLEACGFTVYISRTDNRSGYRDDPSLGTAYGDRPLSTIAREASSNADFFLSIHSNAGGGSGAVNYLLLMLTGTSGSGDWGSSFKYAEAQTAATTCWPYLYDGNELTEWTSTSKRIMSYETYTVISPNYLTIPGFLSEGEFHDYKPETHRLLNKDYCKLESYRFMQFFCDYYGVARPSTGVICGDVRDSVEMTNALYLTPKSGSKDIYTPLNGVTVQLYNSSDVLVDTYTTDSNYNGVYVFWDVAPGTYKLRYTAANHQSLEQMVTVTAGNIATKEVFLIEGSDPVPIEPIGTLYQKILSEETCVWLNNKTIRRALISVDKMYVLTDDSRIVAVNTVVGDSISELSTDGIVASVLKVSDIAFTSDNVLFGCTLDSTSYTPQNSWRVYKWNSDDAAPVQVLASATTATSGNYNGAYTGSTFCVSGTADKFKIYTCAQTTGDSKNTRIVLHDGTSTLYNKNDGVLVDAVGSDVRMVASPFSANQFFIDSKTTYPVPYTCVWTTAEAFTVGDSFEREDVAVSGGTFCKYQGHTLYITPTYGEKLGVTIYEVTSGMQSASVLATLYPTSEILPVDVGYMTAAAEEYGTDLRVTLFAQGLGIVRWQLSQTEFADESVAEPTLVQGADIYASELQISKSDKTYTFSFLINENATDVELQLLYENELVFRKSYSAQTKGEVSIQLDETEIEWPDFHIATDMTWAVKVTARSVNVVTLLNDESQHYQLYASYGLGIDCNSENATFGHIYALNSIAGTCAAGRTTAQGLFAYKADMSPINSSAYTGGITWGAKNSPYRLSVAPDGDVYLCDWSDAHSGVWVADAKNLSGSFAPLFSANSTLSSGIAKTTIGDTIHGSISSCCVLGVGADKVLYTLDEDYIAQGKTLNILKYNIGENSSWSQAPSGFAFRNINGFVVNGNVDIAPDGNNGWWIMQYRYAEKLNEPALIHVNAEGTPDFTTGAELLIGNSYNGALGVSADCRRIATSSSTGIAVWDVIFDAEGQVEGLNLAYQINKDVYDGLGTKVNDIAFDPAGNLYYVCSNTERLVGLGLPKADNSFVTRAPSAQTIALPRYTVTFVDYDSSTIVTQFIMHGDSAVAPAEPTRIGYTFNGWSADFSHIYADTQIVATYRPNDGVAYTVRHWQQDLVDSTYTLIDEEHLYGTTGIQVTPPVKSYTGFTSPVAEPLTILPDGSAVQNYYYNRKVFTVTFYVDDVIYVTQQVMYGASAATPTVPTKTGYVFVRWDTDYSVITGAVEIHAVFEANTVTAVEDVNLTCSVYVQHQQIYVTVSEPTEIVVYASNGQLIHQVIDNHLVVYCVPGAYLVRVGNRTAKVVVQ
ncbi:MAG: InlB B-repeat-containing protein [Paludibacteraceae bacterium]